MNPHPTKPSVLRMPPTLSKTTLLVAAPQDKNIIKGLDNGGDYGDGDDDRDANDDGYDEDGAEVRQRPKPPHHCPHKTPGFSPPVQGRGRERGELGILLPARGNATTCLTRPTTVTCHNGDDLSNLQIPMKSKWQVALNVLNQDFTRPL